MSRYRFKHNELYNKDSNKTIGYIDKTTNIFYGEKGIRETLRLWKNYGIENYFFLSKTDADKMNKM